MDPGSEDVRVAGNIEKYVNHPSTIGRLVFSLLYITTGYENKEICYMTTDTEETYDNEQIQSDGIDSTSTGNRT